MKKSKIFITTTIIVSIISVFAVYLLIDEKEYSASTVENKLNSIKSSAAEEIAFNDLCKNWRISFSSYDKVGTHIDMSKSDWQKTLFKVTFHHPDKEIDYIMKDSKNIYILMKE